MLLYSIVFVLLLASCGSNVSTTTRAPASTASNAPASTAAPKPPTTAATSTPIYGGIIHLMLLSNPSTFDDASQGGPGGVPNSLFAQELWGGDWAKGPGGGYGTKQTDFGTLGYDTFSNKTGYLAQTWTVNLSSDQAQATVVYEIRPGIHFALNAQIDGSRLVNGRELSVDDILAAMKQATTDPKAYIYRSNPELRNLDFSKTGPGEITIKVPVSNLVTAMSRMGDSLRIYPAEVRDKMVDWKYSVGTGPFMFNDFVSSSSMTFIKNPSYWMRDPVGPGKGNQLPYAGGVEFFIIPDASTQLAATRTGKIDEIDTLSWEDAGQLKKQSPQLLSSSNGGYFAPGGFAMYMRTDRVPYSDIRVRRALMMATDFNSIKQNFNGGNGIIIGFPYQYYPEYAGLYAGVDDPALPDSVKEQFVYSPDKAKKLLSDAGFPNGLKTSVLCSTSQADYYSVIADMWNKVGVSLTINPVDTVQLTNLVNGQAYNDFTSGVGLAPTPIYYSGNGINGVPSALTNMSFVDDAKVKAWLPQIRTLAGTDPDKAMALAKQMAIYALDQAWAIQVPQYRTSTFWWPWLKNYSGEISIGYFNAANWTQFVWLDQELKRQMGF
jgi:ABC-type transport system substrate-binding protein